MVATLTSLERGSCAVANDDETPGGEASAGVGATRTLTRSLSEADLALFALVMGEAELEAEAQLDAAPGNRRVAPPALLAALLTTSAAQHSEHPESARIVSGQMRFVAPAYAEDTVQASAIVTGVDDSTGALRITARCEAGDGRRLAEADFLMQRD
jgi:acyl dehydratase